MRRLRLRDGVRDARLTLGEASRLLRAWPWAALELGLVLALLPALVKAFLIVRANGTLIALWEGWIDALMTGADQAVPLMTIIQLTLTQSGAMGLGVTLLDFSRSLILTPLLLCSLALLFNGLVIRSNRSALNAATYAGRQVKDIIVLALLCLVANWLVQMVPSMVSGFLSLLAELLSWIPILGPIASVLALVLSVLISLATDFAVTVIFSFVWICAMVEHVPGIGAIVRSWQITRNGMRETVFTLLGLVVVRLLSYIVLALLWVFLGRFIGLPISGVVYLVCAVNAPYLLWLAATTSALYQHRPAHRGPRPGQFRGGSPDYDNMKRANL